MHNTLVVCTLVAVIMHVIVCVYVPTYVCVCVCVYRWYQAKDLMMMSHLQEGINLADVPTQVTIHTNIYCTVLVDHYACVHFSLMYFFQILYNRSLVQLGMCAFRHGMIKDAHDALMDVQSSGHSKELIAQVALSPHSIDVYVRHSGNYVL